ncbi:MAG TPA: hypothetical protein VFC24_10235 [Casimicrobiaceae bacterium]|nr:hypothetical protein [Casimicrobiaceae bacterium]
MKLLFRPHGIVIRPPHCVELVVSVDEHAVRAMIDWRTLTRVAGRPLRDAAEVQELLEAHRRQIALAIKARLFARGVPFAHELVLTAEDLEALRQPPHGEEACGEFPTPGIKVSLQPRDGAAR